MYVVGYATRKVITFLYQKIGSSKEFTFKEF